MLCSLHAKHIFFYNAPLSVAKLLVISFENLITSNNNVFWPVVKFYFL